MRMYFKEEELLSKEELGVRTKRFVERLSAHLKEGKDEEEAQRAVKNTLTAMGTQKNFKFDSKRPELIEYLFPLGEKEVRGLVEIIERNWEILAAEKPKVPGELKKELEKTLDGGQAVDIALFGRMLANLPEANQYAACQVAHAISTHKVDYDEDFYTAVDDLKPDDNAGADMLGTVEFNSACYYRYAALDLEKLKKNLLGDEALTVKGVEAFLRACVYALPTGKQNTFAAHQLPNFIGFTVRRGASPRSLANAFERPVRSSQEGWLKASAEKLLNEWRELDEVFGQTGKSSVVNRTEAELPDALRGARVSSVDALIETTLAEVEAALNEGTP